MTPSNDVFTSDGSSFEALGVRTKKLNGFVIMVIFETSRSAQKETFLTFVHEKEVSLFLYGPIYRSVLF